MTLFDLIYFLASILFSGAFLLSPLGLGGMLFFFAFFLFIWLAINWRKLMLWRLF